MLNDVVVTINFLFCNTSNRYDGAAEEESDRAAEQLIIAPPPSPSSFSVIAAKREWHHWEFILATLIGYSAAGYIPFIQLQVYCECERVE